MCENPNHEQCEKCSGCVPCGCLCHLMPEGQEETEPPLTLESMGLWPYRIGEALACPKCGTPSSAMTMTFHETAIISMEGTTPCQEWVAKNLIGGVIGEHLCVRCSRCHYGFPMRCADA